MSDWVPAFEGQRPPFLPGNEWRFKPGNELSQLRHGAFSPRRVGPVAEAILQDVLGDPACEYLRQPRFGAELAAWSVAEARCRLLEAYIATRAGGDGVGDLADEAMRAAWSLLHKCESRAMSGRDRLGLSPAASARLGRDKAAAGVDMAMIMKELARLEEQGVDVLAGSSEDEEGDGDR